MTSRFGFVIHPTMGWFGASPDVLVTDPYSNFSDGIAEFKCPYSKREMQGCRKEILTYTAMVKLAEAIQIGAETQRLQKGKYCVQSTHAYKACQHWRSGGTMPQKFLRNFDLYYCIFMVLTSKIDLLPQKLYILHL